MQNIQRLKVIIVGAGEVGMNVAMKLSSHDKIDITLIEADEDRSALMKATVNCRTIKGSGLDPRLLELAGIYDCDLFYAMTDADEVNLLACQLVQSIILRHSIPHVDTPTSSSATNVDDTMEPADHDPFIPCAPLGESQQKRSVSSQSTSGKIFLYARVRDEIFYDHVSDLFPQVNAIFPERTCSRKIDELLHYRQAFDVVELETGRLKLYGIKIHPKSPAVGQSLQDFTADHKITIATIARRKSGALGQSRQLMIPWAAYQMEANDEIYFAASPKTFSHIHRYFTADGVQEHPSSLVIVGDSPVAFDVFQRAVNRTKKRPESESKDHIEEEGHEHPVKRSLSLVISDTHLAERAEQSDPHGNATVVNGSITDIANLAEVGVGPQTTLLVSSTDEENLICALLGRELGCERILIVNNREEYSELINKLGFDGIFSPRQLTVNEMVHQTLRRLSKSAFEVSGSDDFEVRSFLVDKDSPLCDLPLKDLVSIGFPREYAVIAAMRAPNDKSHIMPTGDDILSEGSIVYIVSRITDFHKIDSLFGKRKSRFRLWRS